MADDEWVATTIVAGEGHTLLLTARGALYTWGSGMFGRLGTGWDENETSPVRIRFFSDGGDESKASIASIASGAYHSLALSSDGVVWAWGYNAYRQLGRDDGPSCNVPRTVEFLSQPKIASVYAGGMVSCALEEDGTLWMWGLSPGTGMQTMSPERFPPLLGKQVTAVACGNEHVIALTSSEAYTWGNNTRGQLGLGDKEPRTTPALLQVEEDCNIKAAAAGAFHSAILVDCNHGRSSCWTFGLGENGQLGHGTTLSSSVPKRVELPDEGVVAVDCGLFHTCCVSSTGGVWVWGMEGGLGLFPPSGFGAMVQSGDALSPLNMLTVDAGQFIGVACGASHTAILVHGGRKVLAWGRGRHGVLGTGSDGDSLIPAAVSWPPETDFKAAAVASEDAGAPVEQGSDSGEAETFANNELLKVISGLQEELSAVKQRAIVLESAVRGGDDGFVREWEREVEGASFYELEKYDSFYRRMKNHVKETMLRRKVELWCRSSMPNDSQQGQGQQGSYSVGELEALTRRLNQLR